MYMLLAVMQNGITKGAGRRSVSTSKDRPRLAARRFTQPRSTKKPRGLMTAPISNRPSYVTPGGVRPSKRQLLVLFITAVCTAGGHSPPALARGGSARGLVAVAPWCRGGWHRSFSSRIETGQDRFEHRMMLPAWGEGPANGWALGGSWWRRFEPWSFLHRWGDAFRNSHVEASVFATVLSSLSKSWRRCFLSSLPWGGCIELWHVCYYSLKSPVAFEVSTTL